MSYEQLFSFVVFAESLSFTRAAKALHLSQPALFVQVKKLSETVGRPLYRREKRQLILTPAGERLAAFGRRARDEAREALAEVRGERATGPVMLASGQGALLHLIGPAIRRFPKHKWPLSITTLAASEAVAAVRAARAHLAVVVTDDPLTDLVVEPLARVGQLVVVPRDHRLAARRTVHAAELAGESLIVAPLGSPHRTLVNQLLASAGVTWQVAVETTGWQPMLQLASYGLGLAIVNDFCPVPARMKGIPLAGAPPAVYSLVAAPRLSAGAEHLRALLRDCRV